MREVGIELEEDFKEEVCKLFNKHLKIIGKAGRWYAKEVFLDIIFDYFMFKKEIPIPLEEKTLDLAKNTFAEKFEYLTEEVLDGLKDLIQLITVKIIKEIDKEGWDLIKDIPIFKELDERLKAIEDFEKKYPGKVRFPIFEHRDVS
ncbi:MAG: hypothetical protein QXK35_05890 [Nitrososphaerales archaeon]